MRMCGSAALDPLRPLCAVLRRGSSLGYCLDGGGAGTQVHALTFVRAWPAPKWCVVQPGVSLGWEPEGCTWRCEAGAFDAHTLRVPLHAEFGMQVRKGTLALTFCLLAVPVDQQKKKKFLH